MVLRLARLWVVVQLRCRPGGAFRQCDLHGGHKGFISWLIPHLLCLGLLAPTHCSPIRTLVLHAAHRLDLKHHGALLGVQLDVPLPGCHKRGMAS